MGLHRVDLEFQMHGRIFVRVVGVFLAVHEKKAFSHHVPHGPAADLVEQVRKRIRLGAGVLQQNHGPGRRVPSPVGIGRTIGLLDAGAHKDGHRAHSFWVGAQKTVRHDLQPIRLCEALARRARVHCRPKEGKIQNMQKNRCHANKKNFTV